MQVIQFLRTTLAAALPQVHAMRRRSLLGAVAATLAGAPLSLTGLGRWLPSPTLVKHAITQIDRLLGNRHLQKAFDKNEVHQLLVGRFYWRVRLQEISEFSEHRAHS